MKIKYFNLRKVNEFALNLPPKITIIYKKKNLSTIEINKL
jgi:hypothetical protein